MIDLKTIEQAYISYHSKGTYPANRLPSYKSNYANRTPANKLTGMITDAFKYLSHAGYFKGYANRVNTQGNYNARLKRWIPSGSTKGAADISAMINGRRIEIEVKIGRDMQSAHQRKFQEDIEAGGGVYWIVKSMDDFLDKLNDYIYESR